VKEAFFIPLRILSSVLILQNKIYMNDFLPKELDLIETPFQRAFTINEIPEIGFEHLILDNLFVESDYIKRIYILSSKASTTRGNHAHLNQFQFLILINGSAELKLTNSSGNSTEWNLKAGPVFIPKKHWIELFLGESTKVLSLASSTYLKLQTIHKKDEFLKK
jgi:spore coat polysaccharide biosynthesis predicted glycosyltransferase SpsG